MSLSGGMVGVPADAWDEPWPTTVPTHAARLQSRELITGGAHLGDPLPLVVVLHGRGGGADAFLRHFFALGVPARVVALQAPRNLGAGRGFAWLSGRARHAPPQRVADELEGLADLVSLEIRELVARYPTVGPPILAGYSQGGMVALAVAAQHPEVAGRVIAAASYLPPTLLPTAAGPGPTPHVRLLHGRLDDVVPPAWAHETSVGLREAAWEVELRTVAAGHGLKGRGWARVIGEVRRGISGSPLRPPRPAGR